jgi:hypothetical protein
MVLSTEQRSVWNRPAVASTVYFFPTPGTPLMAETTPCRRLFRLGISRYVRIVRFSAFILPSALMNVMQAFIIDVKNTRSSDQCEESDITPQAQVTRFSQTLKLGKTPGPPLAKRTNITAKEKKPRNGAQSGQIVNVVVAL